MIRRRYSKRLLGWGRGLCRWTFCCHNHVKGLKKFRQGGPGTPFAIPRAMQRVALSTLPETIVRLTRAQEKISHLREQIAHLEKSKKSFRSPEMHTGLYKHTVIVTSLRMS